MGRFPDASSYVCKSLGLRGFEFQLYMLYLHFSNWKSENNSIGFEVYFYHVAKAIALW